MDNEVGTFNKNADKVKRVNKTWSDTNFTRISVNTKTFDRLVCNNCGNETFEVLSNGEYETVAKCTKCNRYFIVHTG